MALATTPEEAVRAALLSLSAVVDLVQDRVWASWFRSPALPAIVMEFDAEEEEADLSGRGGLVIGECNLICRASTVAGARALARAVRSNGTDPGTGLSGWTGTFDAILDSVVIAETPKGDGSKDNWYDANMMFTLLWHEVR